jgi:RNA polymerase sigma factor (sigma-70 family)
MSGAWTRFREHPLSLAPNDDTAEPKRPSTEFAARLRRGDPDAMRQLRDRVRRITGFRRLQIPPHELDDLEQDVMTQVWRAVNRPGFDLNGGIWGFVEVVTARRCIDWLRSRREIVPLSESLAQNDDPLDHALTKENNRIVSDVLSSLGEPCRELILMRLRRGMSFRELSTSLGRSEQALRVQMYRCIRSARAILRRSAR